MRSDATEEEARRRVKKRRRKKKNISKTLTRVGLNQRVRYGRKDSPPEEIVPNPGAAQAKQLAHGDAAVQENFLLPAKDGAEEEHRRVGDERLVVATPVGL